MSFSPSVASPAKNIGTVIQSIIAMLNIDGAFFNPNDVFNKKAAIEVMNNPKMYEKKVKNLTKKYANQKW